MEFYDDISKFLKDNKDKLYVHNSNGSISTGPEYCVFREHLKKKILFSLKRNFKLKFIELNISSSTEKSILRNRGYDLNFETVSLVKDNKIMKPEGFAFMYNEFPKLKHYYGNNCCYYSITSSFRNEKSKKCKIIRSFQFEQLEFQLPHTTSFDKITKVVFSCLSTMFYDKISLLKKEELPFYSSKTVDLEIKGLELASLSVRKEGVNEISIGIMRTFISMLSNLEKKGATYLVKDKLLLKKLKKLNTKFTRVV